MMVSIISVETRYYPSIVFLSKVRRIYLQLPRFHWMLVGWCTKHMVRLLILFVIGVHPLLLYSSICSRLFGYSQYVYPPSPCLLPMPAWHILGVSALSGEFAFVDQLTYWRFQFFLLIVNSASQSSSFSFTYSTRGLYLHRQRFAKSAVHLLLLSFSCCQFSIKSSFAKAAW